MLLTADNTSIILVLYREAGLVGEKGKQTASGAE